MSDGGNPSEERDGDPSGHDETLDMADRPAGPVLPATTDPLPVIPADRYAIEREHARGGLGRILVAHDRRLGRRVAIKELIHHDADHEARFLREVRVTARLQHPSIVAMYEAGRWPSGAPFYAMRMVDGVPLSAILAEARTLNERLVLLPNVIAVADAMAHAHSREIIHRDLKPANILVGSFGETVVIDWGLAKDLREDAGDERDGANVYPSVDDRTIEGSIMGTPAYMPPEQARGNPADRRADVYALGAILYHVLAGHAPYGPAVDVEALLELVRRGSPPPILAEERGAPPDLVAIAEKAMAHRPGDRYADARELAEDLHLFSTGQLVAAHRWSRWSRLRRWLARHRGRAAAVSIAVAALAGFLVVGAFDLVDTRDRAIVERDRAEAALTDERARRGEIEARNHQLVLAQARAALDRDPTETLAWLRQLPADSRGWRAARILAADARERGFASEERPVAPSDFTWARFAPPPRAVSPDGKTVATWERGALTIAPEAGGPARVLRGHRGSIVDYAFAADGASLRTLGDDGTVRRWPIAWAGPPRPGTGKTQDFWFVQAGASIVTEELDGELRAVSLANGEVRPIRAAGLIPKSISVVSGGSTVAVLLPAIHDVVLHDLATARSRVHRIADARDPHQVVLLPWEQYVVVVERERLHVVDSSGSRRVVEDAGGTATTMSADGRMIAAWGSGGAIKISYPYAPARPRHVLVHGVDPVDVALSSDGSRLAATIGDRVRVYDLGAGTYRDVSGHGADVTSVQFAPDGSALASGGADGGVRLWKLDGTGRALGAHRARVAKIRFAPDSARLVSVSGEGGDVRLWDLESGEHRRLPVDTSIDEVRFSPDGLTIALLARGRIAFVSDDLPTNPPALRAWIDGATTFGSP